MTSQVSVRRSCAGCPLFILLVAAAVNMLLAGCSLTMDLNECQDDDDCIQQHGDGWVCSEDNLCDAVGECETDDDCIQEYGHGWSCDEPAGECRAPENLVFCDETSECEAIQGDGWTCSIDGVCEPPPDSIPCGDDEDCASHQQCSPVGLCQDTDTGAELLGGPCQVAVGDVDDDGAFIVGMLLPFSGAEAGFGESLLNGIELARADFDTAGGIDDRSIALIGCDTESDMDTAVAGAQHLADVGVQAVIGPDWSDQTQAVAQQVTIDAEMVLVSPSATAAAISDIDDNGLVWRTVASDEGQGQALGKLIAYALDTLPHYDGLDEDSIPEHTSLAIMHRRDDLYGEGLVDAIIDQLPDDIVSDDDRHFVGDYPIGASSGDIAANVMANTADGDFGPDIIVMLGAAEAWEAAELLEDEFDNPPLFIFADAGRVLDYTDGITDELQGRVWGTAPRNASELNYEPYNSFRFRYQQQYDEDPQQMQFVPNAFDALYILGLGAARGGFDGPDIAEGMTHLSHGDTFGPSSFDLPEAMQQLSRGESINFDGASWKLNFDDTGTPAPMPTALWCFEDGGLPEHAVIFDENEQFTPIGCGEQPESADNGAECTDDSDCTEIPDHAIPICQDGECMWTCSGDLSPCGGQCVDTDSDDDHCGSCDNSCGDGESCTDGNCQ